MSLRALALIVPLAMPLLPAAAQDMQPPPGWRWIPDAGSGTRERAAPDSSVRFVMMPPGWHLTTGPGGLVFDPSLRAEGRFTLESEMFVFPQTMNEGYGLFLGGRALGTDSALYIAVLLRADGSLSVQHRHDGETTTLHDWVRHDSIAVRKAGGTGKNVVRVRVEASRLRVTVNGAEVAVVSVPEGVTDGQFGFRLGREVNLHASTLDLTRHLAPPRS